MASVLAGSEVFADMEKSVKMRGSLPKIFHAWTRIYGASLHATWSRLFSTRPAPRAV